MRVRLTREYWRHAKCVYVFQSLHLHECVFSVSARCSNDCALLWELWRQKSPNMSMSRFQPTHTPRGANINTFLLGRLWTTISHTKNSICRKLLLYNRISFATDNCNCNCPQIRRITITFSTATALLTDQWEASDQWGQMRWDTIQTMYVTYW